MPRRLHGSGFWKRRARLQLMHHPLCTICLAKGVVTPATVADHVEPITATRTAFTSASCNRSVPLAIPGGSSRLRNWATTRPSARTAGQSIPGIPSTKPGSGMGPPRGPRCLTLQIWRVKRDGGREVENFA